jgi:hypothetical protein
MQKHKNKAPLPPLHFLTTSSTPLKEFESDFVPVCFVLQKFLNFSSFIAIQQLSTD